ncbi:hypothetical protein Tco_1476735 [Tanacetum coccineum]
MTTPSPSPPISLSPPSAGERLARDRLGFVSTVDAEEMATGIRDVGVRDLGDTWVRIQQEADLFAILEDAQEGDSYWMVEEEAYVSREAWARSIGLSQATHQELQTHRDHVYAHETYLQAHQTQLQLQGTLIQTQHQDQMVERTLRVIREYEARDEATCSWRCWHCEMPLRRDKQSGPKARIVVHQEGFWGRRQSSSFYVIVFLA